MLRIRGASLSLSQRLCHSTPLILAYRLGRFFLAREKPAPSRKFVAPTVTGSLYSYETGDMLGDLVRMCGFWDWRLLAVAKAVAWPGAHVIEIGANTGTETLGLADIVGPAGRVTAFEPEVTNFGALRENVTQNGFSHVRILALAVYDSIGMVSFRSTDEANNSGRGYINGDESLDHSDAEVNATTLDSLEPELGATALVTIDVEGAETAVLRGSEGFLRRHRPVLYVEASDTQLARFGSNLGELAARLRSLGYDPYEVCRFWTRPVETIPHQREHNWLAIPIERPKLRARVDRMLRLCAFAPRIRNFHPLLTLPPNG